ncbi:MAG: HIT family protein [Candidatus Pacebacteria bacterium]|nr:HIT family protein [Candidatus Paceibacterota bacterium]
MENCIFCKIVRGEIPHGKVYEDENTFAFLDIEPISMGHILVIPKEHVVWMQDASDELISEIFKLSKRLMITIKKIFNCDYVQLAISGKDVAHFHIHLIPRYLDDGLSNWPTKKYKDGEMEETAKKIIAGL